MRGEHHIAFVLAIAGIGHQNRPAVAKGGQRLGYSVLCHADIISMLI